MSFCLRGGREGVYKQLRNGSRITLGNAHSRNLVFTNGGPPGANEGSNAKTRRCRIKIADDQRSDWANMSVLLCEDDIFGSPPAGRNPAELKTEELRFLAQM